MASYPHRFRSPTVARQSGAGQERRSQPCAAAPGRFAPGGVKTVQARAWSLPLRSTTPAPSRSSGHDERLHGRGKPGGKIAKHLTAASPPDRANGDLIAAHLHGRAPPGGSPQLVRRPGDGNRPAAASRRFRRREHRPQADEREAASPIASQLERTAVEVAHHRLSEAATRPEPTVAIIIADRVAGLPPTDPLDHEHRVTLPQPLLALGPSTNGGAYSAGSSVRRPTGARQALSGGLCPQC